MKTSTLVLASSGLAGAQFTAAAAPEPAATADIVLAKVVQAYASLNSYEDSGSVTRDDGDESPYRISFTTLYQSPSRFRSGFDGAAAYFVMKPFEKPPQSVPTPNIDSALARATGISSGAAHTISRLLLRDVSGLSILDLVDARWRDDAHINGVECHAISTRHPRNGGEWTLWIEKDTLLIRKLRTPLGAQDGRFSAEVHDNIRINQAIQDSRFKIDA